jgi:hypothetical protein
VDTDLVGERVTLLGEHVVEEVGLERLLGRELPPEEEHLVGLAVQDVMEEE